jgi:hypothetical protein
MAARDPAVRHLAAKIAIVTRWSRLSPEQRAAATKPARDALAAKREAAKAAADAGG